MTLPTVTQTFDQSIGEYGQDYAVPMGTPIYSPVSGIFSTEDKGKVAWGKRAFVHATTGLNFAVGHLTSFAKQPGQQVNAGDLIGYSGGAASDPSSGVSTGPHVETQFFTQAGKYVDPRSVFAKLASWEQAIFSGSSSNGLSGASSSIIPGVDGIAAALGSAQAAAIRAFWIAAGIGIAIFGLVMIFFDDIKGAIEAGQDATAKAAKVAATVAPEVAA